jgi:hypothetical protein
MTPESRNSSLLTHSSGSERAIDEPISTQRFGKNTTIEVLLETVFSMWAVPRLYKENLRQLRVDMAVEEDGEETT